MTIINLTREVNLPPELAVAASTGRPELCKTLTRKLSKAEQVLVVDALAVYIETTHKMQEEINRLTGLRVMFRSAIMQAKAEVLRLSNELIECLKEEARLFESEQEKEEQE